MDGCEILHQFPMVEWENHGIFMVILDGLDDLWHDNGNSWDFTMIHRGVSARQLGMLMGIPSGNETLWLENPPLVVDIPSKKHPFIAS